MLEVEIINNAIDEYKPFRVFALFSGGNDSVCASTIASQAKQFDGVVFIDTGIRLEASLPYAKSVADKFGWNFQSVTTPTDYEKVVLKHGFPGAYAHKFMYIMLKERALDKLLRETKTKRRQNILLITGVRQQESDRRMENVTDAVVKDGSKIWVAPMWQWSAETKEAYIQEKHLPKNPFKEIIHVSGDCLCGAYNQKGDLEILKVFFPNDAKRILELQERVMKSHPWSWDEMPPKWWKQYMKGQRFLGKEFMPMCWNCDHVAAANTA